MRGFDSNDGRLRLRPPAFPGEKLPVFPGVDSDDGSAADFPAAPVSDDFQTGYAEYHLCAGVPRSGFRFWYLPAKNIFPGPAEGSGGGGRDRRMQYRPAVPDDYGAAVPFRYGVAGYLYRSVRL